MAKTESTAVNDLIQIAATQKPLPVDPSEDLMFAIPSKKDRSSKLSARGTAQVPPLPLPRDRAPHGTEEHAISRPANPIATTRSTPMPPLPGNAMRTSTPPQIARIPTPPQIARTPTPPQIARTPMPPPLPSSSAAIAVAPLLDTPLPELRKEPSIDPVVEPIATRTTRPSLPPPMRPALPSEYPVVSAVHSLPMAPAPVARVRTETPWADDDVDVDLDGDVATPFHGDSTAQVAKPRTNLEWIVKLAPWMGVMVILGVAVGAYIVFDGQGGTQRAASPSVDVKVVADTDPVAVAIASPTDDSPVIAAPVAEPPAIVAAPSAAEPAAAASASAVTPPNLAASTVTTVVTPPNLVAATAPSPAADVPALPSTTTAPAPIPAPATPSITTPAPTAAIAKRPAFVDVRLDSKPVGATVMLVDRGKQTFLGTTPISTAVDPTRAYDVVFAYPNRQTQIEHLDPKATARLSVVLGRPGTRATPELAKPVAAPTEAAPAKVAKVAKAAKAAKIVEPAWEAPAPIAATATKLEAAPAADARAEKAVGGNGLLMISSKPPCEIHVDGKPTGLMTPQRALPLSAGKHRITLVNPAQKIRKSLAVEITANASTKVIQDLMP